MKIVIASDHGGYQLKQAILRFLSEEKIAFEDFGINSAESADYPDYAVKVAKAVSVGEVDAGILVCGTGLGMTITANKFKGVRAALITDIYLARMAKEHNNANVIALGGRMIDAVKAIRLLKIWLKTPFQGERHQKRLDKIKEIEKENFK